MFDSTVNLKPVTFPMTDVMGGWKEGLLKMRKGGKATLVVPAALGYGDEGAAPAIPPGATLVFVIEVVDVK